MKENNNLPEYLKDYSGYLIGIKNLSEVYVKNIISTVKQFLDFVNIHILKNKYADSKDITINDIRTITNSNIYSYLFYLAENHYKASSRITKTEFLRNFFDYLFRIKHNIFQEPLKKIKREKKQVSNLPNYLSLEESKKLLSVYATSTKLKDIRNNAIIYLFLNCGLRHNELRSLNITDLNLNNNTFLINGKGNKERTGYLNDSTKSALMEYLKVRDKFFTGSNSVALFLNENGCRMSKCSINRLVDKAYIMAGLDPCNYGVHTLRHTCATILYKSGIDIKVIQELLGHSQVKTTEIYTHLYDKDVEKEMLNHPLAKFKIKNALCYVS